MSDRVKGWCPGALRPMPSGDGLIVRLRISCAEATLALTREIADCALAHGNGELDLTGRSAWQIRGVGEAALPALRARLAGLLDASAEVEAVRNVLVSPFAGLDPDSACDVRPYAQAWERELALSPELWALPGKFAVAFDAGSFPLGVDSDLAVFAVAPDAFVIRLGGGAEIPLEPVAGGDLVAVLKTLALAFLSTPARRMRDAVRQHGVARFAAAAGLAGGAAGGETRRRTPDAWLGAHALGDKAFVGLGLPFGRIAAAELRALVDLAQAAGATELRLTPWRALLAPAPTLQAAHGLAEAARRLGLIVEPDDPLLAVAACAGAPACAGALGSTRDVARRLAPLLPPRAGIVLHVSGCAKGCAHPAPARLTLVATADGYDAVTEGRADTVPFARAVPPSALPQLLEEIV